MSAEQGQCWAGSLRLLDEADEAVPVQLSDVRTHPDGSVATATLWFLVEQPQRYFHTVPYRYGRPDCYAGLDFGKAVEVRPFTWSRQVILVKDKDPQGPSYFVSVAESPVTHAQVRTWAWHPGFSFVYGGATLKLLLERAFRNRDPMEDAAMEIEHLGLNVREAAAMADWYVAHLGMRIVLAKDEPVPVRFLADSADDVMIEIYSNPAAEVLDYPALDPLSLHVAFSSDDIRHDFERLLGAGAASAREPTGMPSGDQIAIVRDPWGLPIQLVRRLKPMI